MRKLGILLAVMVAATLGYSGTASADGHEETLCPNITGNPVSEGIIEADGEPLASTLTGAEESCVQSNSDDGLHPSPLLCGAADGLDVTPGEDLPLGSTVRELNDGLEESQLDFDGQPVDFDVCPNGDDDDDDDGNAGDDDDNTQVEAVQRNNATPDGGLPRTGGELFAGAGLGLMSLGALVRRFLP